MRGSTIRQNLKQFDKFIRKFPTTHTKYIRLPGSIPVYLDGNSMLIDGLELQIQWYIILNHT